MCSPGLVQVPQHSAFSGLPLPRQYHQGKRCWTFQDCGFDLSFNVHLQLQLIRHVIPVSQARYSRLAEEIQAFALPPKALALLKKRYLRTRRNRLTNGIAPRAVDRRIPFS